MDVRELPETTEVEPQAQPDDCSGESPENDAVSGDSQLIPDDHPRQALGFRARLYKYHHDEKWRGQVEHDFWLMIQEGAPDEKIHFLEDYD